MAEVKSNPICDEKLLSEDACLHISASALLGLCPYIDGAIDLCVSGINRDNIGQVREYLLKFYPLDYAVVFHPECGKSLRFLLKDLFLGALSGEGCAVIKGESGFDKKAYTFGDLMRIMERLTASDGCPWDIKQTHQSIRDNMIEEAGEAAAAIDNGDLENLIEELGDVMLQSIFHADIGRRSGEFEIGDVITRLCRKLFTRHTHVFGDNKASSAEDALESWKQAKAQEKMERGK